MATANSPQPNTDELDAEMLFKRRPDLVDAFLTPELTKKLQQAFLRSNPELVKTLAQEHLNAVNHELNEITAAEVLRQMAANGGTLPTLGLSINGPKQINEGQDIQLTLEAFGSALDNLTFNIDPQTAQNFRIEVDAAHPELRYLISQPGKMLPGKIQVEAQVQNSNGVIARAKHEITILPKISILLLTIKGTSKVKIHQDFKLEVEASGDANSMQGLSFSFTSNPNNFFMLVSDPDPGKSNIRYITPAIDIATPGSYQLGVSVTNAHGNIASASHTVNIGMAADITLGNKQDELVNDPMLKQAAVAVNPKASIKQSYLSTIKTALQDDAVLKQRQQAALQALASGNPLGLLKMESLEKDLSLTNEAKQYLKGKWGKFKTGVNNWAKVKAGNALLSMDKKFFKPLDDNLSQNQTYVEIKIFTRKSKDKKQQGQLGGFLLGELFKGAIKAVVKTAQVTIKTAGNAVKIAGKIPGVRSVVNAIANSKTGQWIKTNFAGIANENGLADDTANQMHAGLNRFGDKLVRVYQDGKNLITPHMTGLSKIGLGVGRYVRLAGNMFSALPHALVSGAAATILSGGNIGVGVATGGFALFSKGFTNMLANPSLMSHIFSTSGNAGVFAGFSKWFNRGGNLARYAQLHYGSGAFYNPDGSLNLSPTASQAKLQAQVGNIYGNSLVRGVRALNNGMFLGSILVPLAPLLGINPLAAYAVGLGIGSAGTFAYESIVGSKIASVMINKSSAVWLKFITRIPFMQIVNSYVSNTWMASQMNILIKKYGFRFNEYFKEEWGINSNNPAALMMALPNLLGLGGYAMTSLGLAKSIIARPILQLVTAGQAVKTANPVIMVSSVIGSIAGFALGAYLGLGVGPMAILGATIGSIVGTIAGLGISAVAGLLSGGWGLLGAGLITATSTGIFQLFGQWLGSKFDKGINNFMGGALNFIQGATAFFQFINLINSPLNAQALVMLVFSLITLSSLGNKGLTESGANKCIKQSEVCSSEDSSFINNKYHEYSLDHYGVTLIATDQQWNYQTMNIIINTLDKVDPAIWDNLPDKKIYLALGQNGVFEEQEFILIGIQDYTNRQQFSKSLNQYLAKFTDQPQPAALINSL